MSTFKDYLRLFLVAELDSAGYSAFLMQGRDSDLEGSINFFGSATKVAEVSVLDTDADIKSAVASLSSYCGYDCSYLEEDIKSLLQKERAENAQKIQDYILLSWELGINPLPALRKQGFNCDSSHDEFAVISSPEIGELKIDWVK